MAKIVTINSEILASIRAYKINSQEAQLYLLGVYFGLETGYISEITRKQVNALGIVKREYKDNSSVVHTIKWTVPLFNEEKDEPFAWTEGFREAFGRINPDRKGTKSAVTSRMKKFFAEHPEVRMEEVKAATEDYISTVKDPQYLKSAHKFICEGVGVNRVSMLEQYVEKIKVSGTADGRTSKMN
jgi:hypothetical protein